MNRPSWKTSWRAVAAILAVGALAAPTARADENHVRGQRRGRDAASAPSLAAPRAAPRTLPSPSFSGAALQGRSRALDAPGIRLGNPGNATNALTRNPFESGRPFRQPTFTPPGGGSSAVTRTYRPSGLTASPGLGVAGQQTNRFRSSENLQEAMNRLRNRTTQSGLPTQFGSTVGVRRGTVASPTVDTFPTAGSTSGVRVAPRVRQVSPRYTNPTGTLSGNTYSGTRSGTYSGLRTGTSGPVLATRSGSVSYGGGALTAAHRTGVVSYRYRDGYRYRNYWGGGGYPWWWYSGPRYGFGFGISYYDYYDPWPWYGTWGFATVYQPYPVYVPQPVYVPEPVYVVPPSMGYGYSVPGYVDPGYVDPGYVNPGTVSPGYVDPGNVVPAPAPQVQSLPESTPAPPIQPEGGQPPAADGAPVVDEATRKGLEESFELFRAKKYAEAFDRLTVVVRATPTSGEAWMGRFYAAFPIGRYADAASSLRSAATLGAFPRGYRFDPRPLYGDEASKAFDTLFARLATHLNANPGDADGYAVLAYLHVALGRQAEAEAALANLTALRPDDTLAPALRTALLPAEAPSQANPSAPTGPVAPSQPTPPTPFPAPAR